MESAGFYWLLSVALVSEEVAGISSCCWCTHDHYLNTDTEVKTRIIHYIMGQNVKRPTCWISSSEKHVKEVFRRDVRLEVIRIWALSVRVSPLVPALVVLLPFGLVTQYCVGVSNCWEMIKQREIKTYAITTLPLMQFPSVQFLYK